jgi:hypothetical protein
MAYFLPCLAGKPLDGHGHAKIEENASGETRG